MLKAMLIMLVAMSAIPAGDAASKILTSDLGVAPTYVVWTRFLIGGLVILPFTWRAGLSVWRDWRVWFRAALIGLGISCITRALQLAPLADVFGAFFIGPLVSFVLSVWLLKERANIIQAVLVLIGFFGVLFIVRPGFEASAGLGWALLAGCTYGAFLTAAQETRHDLELLAHRFGASIEQVAHRLSTLQRPGAKGIPFFFVRVDQAGTITKRHSATRLQFARFGGACPLWNVHRAFETPGRFLRQLAETPDGVFN